MDGAALILDEGGQRVYANAAWEAEVAGEAAIEAQIRRARAAGRTHFLLPSGRIIHWETLEASFPIAPGGLFVTVERPSEHPVMRRSEGAIEEFCARNALTPRESDIVALILAGYPGNRIAERLTLSLGTVKNHRWRLCYKLDITTERELFVQFLSGLLASSVPVSAPLRTGSGRGVAR